MATPPRTGGGALVALGAIAGVVIGFPFQQATLGLLTGLALGVLAALLLWLRERRN